MRGGQGQRERKGNLFTVFSSCAFVRILLIVLIITLAFISIYRFEYQIHEIQEEVQPATGTPQKKLISNDTDCPQPLYIVHWTHVPKAGGTAWAEIAKKIACEKNKNLFEKYHIKNPCCIPHLCLKDSRCDTSFAGGCPLVQNIGIHTFNAARLADVPCFHCGYRWFQVSLDKGILQSSLRNPPISTGKNTAIKREVESHILWPLKDRIRFFARAGAQYSTLWNALHHNGVGPPSKIYSLLRDVRNISCSHDSSIPPMSIVNMTTTDIKAKNTQPLFCDEDGSHSLTVIRHPFQRSASAFFYRGHSPNYDVFNLRPGLWLPPYIQRANITLRTYFTLPEYQNVMTKMFGHDVDCRPARRRGCSAYGEHETSTPLRNSSILQLSPPQFIIETNSKKKTHSCRCAVFEGCPAYRNDSMLNSKHAAAAATILKRHAFVALQEAPIASALLAAHTFSLKKEEIYLNSTRPSITLKRKCSPARVMRTDPSACRAACQHHALDLKVYEVIHRNFCRRLHDFDIFQYVKHELRSNRLCGKHDFSNPNHVCGPLETPHALDTLFTLRNKCRRANKDPQWWLKHYGFYSETPNE